MAFQGLTGSAAAIDVEGAQTTVTRKIVQTRTSGIGCGEDSGDKCQCRRDAGGIAAYDLHQAVTDRVRPRADRTPILVDWARAEKADKRWGRLNRIAIPDVPMAQAWRGEDLLALDEALERLEALDPRAAEVVELRYFAGLSEADTADTLNVSVSTVKRDWEFARTWLVTQLRPLAHGQTTTDD